jgi:hypothetical protein
MWHRQYLKINYKDWLQSPTALHFAILAPSVCYFFRESCILTLLETLAF